MPGSWTHLRNQPTFNAGTMLLLTDGSVLCHDETGSGTADWWKLVPDASGDYVNGAWQPLASGPVSPLYFASTVLKDGRVFRAGGEYDGDPNTVADLLAAEIYDPAADAWTILPTPAGWVHIGDASCCAFPDGRVLLGSIDDNRTAVYDPTTNAWTAAAAKRNATSDEETWTLLPDETILTADCVGHPGTEKYVIADDVWVDAGPTVTDLVEDSSKEIGPAILLPDGRVFAIGATGHTGLYTMPSVASQPGTWTDGPAFPVQNGQQLIAKDAPAALLPNGRVLCAVGPAGGCPVSNDGYCPPTFFFEYDPVANSLTAVGSPPNAGGAVFTGRMLLLPTGQVLFSNGSQDIEVYTPDGSPDPAWQPRITACAAHLQPGRTYPLQGQQLNGLSQAVSYGDDATMATNYPLVRIRNIASNRIVYCRTHDHSTLGVATGNAVHSTDFDVPAGIEVGASELTVVANGISSAPVAVTIDPAA
jgi:hypothetical protein